MSVNSESKKDNKLKREIFSLKEVIKDWKTKHSELQVRHDKYIAKVRTERKQLNEMKIDQKAKISALEEKMAKITGLMELYSPKVMSIMRVFADVKGLEDQMKVLFGETRKLISKQEAKMLN